MAAGSPDLATLERWRTDDLISRLWHRDPTVWFDPPRPEIDDRLGWLDLPSGSTSLLPIIGHLADTVRAEGITDVVLCGMGGSSLAPEVFASALGTAGPRLTVVDTTHPDAITAISSRLDPSTTWYIVSSKSGGTLETLSVFRYFWSITADALEDPGAQFLAITDPGSSLAELADARGFRSVVLADPDVGGRYSALSAFGLVPAGIIGADVRRLLAAARRAADACGPSVPLEDNPAFTIGALLATRANRGDPIARFVGSGTAAGLPAWIEQLIAESTGKDGLGIVPIDDGPPIASGTSILIGQPADGESADVVMTFDDPYEVAGAMFTLELATAIAGEVLGIHPFDQPDVQRAKTLAHEAMAGTLVATGPEPVPVGGDAWTQPLLDALEAGPLYVALQAYCAGTETMHEALERLREVVSDRSSVPVTVGYGPRFLHSTGQLHKGGPNGGCFIQFTDTPIVDVAVPETTATFGELITGQAAGDRAALDERGRTLIAIDLGSDAVAGVDRVATVLAAG